MTFRNSIHFKLFISHLLVVVFVSGCIGTFFYLRAVDSIRTGLQERLQASAALISWTLDADTIRHIRTKDQTDDTVYVEVLDYLRSLRKTNQDISYLYIMRREGEKIFFVVDSDESEEGQALPGHEYTQILPSIMKGFFSTSGDDEPVPDDWGVFLSGYAPLKNSRGEYLLGVDMRADTVKEKFHRLHISAIISVVAAVVLAFFLARMLSSRFMSPINMAIQGCTEIAAGKLETRINLHTNSELDQLFSTFNDMAAALSGSEKVKAETLEALLRSRNELEIRVEQRTSDLKEVNDRLSNEIAMRLVAQQALHEAATTDNLTRLWNRRAMIDRLEHEISRFKRTQTPFTVLMMDLDFFKTINDAKGHSAGDAILEETALRMKSMLRSQDTAARWGGEEFVILLPETSVAQGLVVAEKLRCRLGDSPYFYNGEAIAVTASFGVAQFDGTSDAMTLVNEADKAMYEAKNNGRNRVEVA